MRLRNRGEREELLQKFFSLPLLNTTDPIPSLFKSFEKRVTAMQPASPFFVLDLRLDHFANCRQNDSRTVVVVIDRAEIHIIIHVSRVARAHANVINRAVSADLTE